MNEKEFQKFKEIISPGDLIFIFYYSYDNKLSINSFIYLAPTIFFENTFKLLCLKHQDPSIKGLRTNFVIFSASSAISRIKLYNPKTKQMFIFE